MRLDNDLGQDGLSGISNDTTLLSHVQEKETLVVAASDIQSENLLKLLPNGFDCELNSQSVGYENKIPKKVPLTVMEELSNSALENVERQNIGNSGSDNESNDAILDRVLSSHHTQLENIIIKPKTQKKKRITLIDSDSEPEFTDVSLKIEEKNSELTSKIGNRSFIDSDESDSDIHKKEKTDNKNHVEVDRKLKKKSRIQVLADSDSDEEPTNDFNKNDPNLDPNSDNIRNNQKITDQAPIYITNQNGEVLIENPKNISFHKSRLAALCDPDSEEDYPIENTNYHNFINSDLQSDGVTAKNTKSLRKGGAKPKGKEGKKNNAESKDTKTFKMTPKEAAKQREEIAAESQRMIREKDVSLPYHKPKAHSLKEFLTRRSKLSSVVPVGPKMGTSIATALRMSKEQLLIFQKRLEEREKELKEFYKSDSESDKEDPDDKDYIPEGLENESEDEQTNLLENKKPTQELPDELDNGTKDDHQSINLNKEDIERIETTDENIINANPPLTTESKGNAHPVVDDNDFLNINSDAVDLNSTSNNKTEDFSLRLEETEQHNDNEEEVQKRSSEICINIPEKVSEDNVTAVSEDKQQDTMSYDFNLDDFSETSDLSKSNNDISVNEIDKITTSTCNNSDNTEPIKKFEYGELDAEIENFGVNKVAAKKINILSDVTIPHNETSPDQDTRETDAAPTKTKLQLLKEQLAKSTPKLSGKPDQLIDLDEGSEKSTAVTRLMERYAKHVSSKKNPTAKQKVSLSIVTVESGGDIHQETVAMNVNEDENAVPVIEEKPGAKLQRLRKELQSHMEKEKSERWQKKASEGIKPLTTDAEEKEGYEDDLPDEYDDEEEEILTDEDEEEMEENDIDMEEKPHKKRAFVDAEAEESDTEEQEQDNVEDAESEAESNKVDEDNATTDNEIQDGDETSNMSADSESQSVSGDELPELTADGKKRPLKRIVKAFDDSDSECESDLEKTLVGENAGTGDVSVNKESREREQGDDDEDEISAYQPQPNKTPIREMTQPQSDREFDTPISFITGLESLRSASKSVKSSPAPIVSPFQMPQDSPLRTCSLTSQKKLFPESDVESQESDPISESQTDHTNHTSNDEGVASINLANTMPKEDTPCTQDILDICSGDFTGITQIDSTEKSAVSKSLVLDSQSQTQEVKSLGEEQDLIISQLLDEEELENFKKKFESPINKPSTQKVPEENEIVGGGILESDDEENGEQLTVKVKNKKKKNRKIAFSDDESSEEEEENEDIDLQDNEDLDDEELDNIGYDSEENEIQLDNGEKPKKEKLKIKDFMEDEAELSESEWGSEDEDEKDLDKLEFEAGDNEKFDEDQMKEDLEKIHMRRLLDDDTREVKLLQELLLEDGEMHGTGRQRQFRWKNIDDMDETDDTKRDDEDVYLDEEESEEQWRRRRHEREMFLKEKISQSQTDDSQDTLLGKSQLLLIGQKILERSQSLNSQNGTPPATAEKPVEKTQSPLLPRFTLLNKRGSFLSRGEEVLQRVAEFTKVSTTYNVNGTTKKTTKNFVFQSLATTELAQTKKRKAQDGTPNVLKKLRLSNTFSPAADVKKRKPEKAKKLF